MYGTWINGIYCTGKTVAEVAEVEATETEEEIEATDYEEDEIELTEYDEGDTEDENS